MLLSAADEDDVNYWTKQINTYRNILKAHSVNFNFAKLASIRIDLILQRVSSENVQGGMTAISTPQSADNQNIVESQTQGSVSAPWPESEVNFGPFTGRPLQEVLPNDPLMAFGNTYGLEWEFDFDFDGVLTG